MPDVTTTPHDYTQEAKVLFAAFADRYGLIYDVDEAAPVEVCWRFPVQEHLSVPITLALQNGDEINFCVAEFWSYFFPFPKVAGEFDGILDAWAAGKARVVTGIWGSSLQVFDAGHWKTVYRAGRFFPAWGRRERLVQNQRSEQAIVQ